MRTVGKKILIGAVVFNLGLVLVTLALSKQAEIAHPMEGVLVNLDGTNMHVIKSAPRADDKQKEAAHDAMVLIHGASTSALDFKSNLLPELSDRHTVLAIDRPGHGYSERSARPDMHHPSQQAGLILDTLAKLNIERPVLIGHSWAGSVVLAALLLNHPTVDPAAGVLIAGESHPYESEDSTPTKLALAPYFGPIFRYEYLTPVGRMAIEPTVESYFAPDRVPENYIDDTGLHLSLRPDTYLYNARDRSRLGEHLVDQSKLYPSLETPLLSIAASGDHVVPPSDHHDMLLEDVPTATAVAIEGAGHSPHHTRTDEVVEAIESFVDELR